MAKDFDLVPHHRHAGVSSDQENEAGRFSWLRRRRTVILGVALLAIVLAIFVGGRVLASQDQVAAAAQSQNDQLSTRAYQFTGQGLIQGGSGMTWIIGGVPVLVSNQTQIGNSLHPGDMVSVLGHITQDGKWLAERINLVSDQESFFSFGGPLEARSQTAWRVAGISLSVNDKTHVGAQIQDNDLVLATFKVLPDGTWMGLDIESLSALAASATPTTDPSSVTAGPSNADQQTISNQQPPAYKPSDQTGKGAGCYKSKGKGGNWKHGNGGGPCSGSDQGDDEGGD